MARSRQWRMIVAAAVLTLAAPWPSLAGRNDPAPLTGDVVQRLVHGRQRRALAAPEVLARQAEGALALAEREESEDRSLAGRDDDPAPRDTKASLLAAKLHELRGARTELDREIAALRGRMSAARAGTRQAWEKDVSEAQRRLDDTIRSLEDVDRAATRGQRRRALLAARGRLEPLKEALRRDRQAAEGPPRTFEQRPNLWHAPEPATAPAPRYAGGSPGLTPRAASDQRLADGTQTLVDGGAGLTALAAAEAASCNSTADDLAATPDVQLTPEIRDLAASLDNSPARIYQWVSNEIAFEPYYGSLKGAAATLSSRAGNATDQASLLIALLRAANVPARYVKGRVDFVDPRVQRWVGAKTYAATAAILNAGLVPVTRLVDAANNVTGVRITHVWVQACVPYGNYRGTAIDRSGYRWVPLDPSFKEKTYQDGIPTNVSFDYASYLAARSEALPHEKYAEQVEAWIKGQPPSFGNNTLEDVPYKGRLLPRTIDILPATLPYFVNGFIAWDTGLTAETASLPARHRYRWTIEVRNNAGTLLAPPLDLALPDVVQQRVTLSFQGASAGDQTTLDNWRADANVDAGLPCAVNVVPVVKVEGANRAVGTTAVGICTENNKLSLRLFLDEVTLGTPRGDVNKADFTNIKGSDYHALVAYAFQASDTYLARRATRLLAGVQANANPHANLEETEGEFLHLVGMKYMRTMSDGGKEIGALDGGTGQSGNHLGLTSARMKITYLFDRPFALYRSGLLVDVPGGQSRSCDLTTGSSPWKTFLLFGYSASAYESWIWQENARLDAVSTVRGIQFANEKGIEVLSITSANQTTQIPKLTSNANSALNYSAGQVAGIQNMLSTGYTITAPRSLIQYENWKGAVYVAEKNDALTGEQSAGFIIGGGYAGGFTVMTPVESMTTFNDAPWGWVYDIHTMRMEYKYNPYWSFWSDYYLAPTAPPPAPEIFIPAAPPILNSTVTLGPAATPAGDPVNMVTGNMYHMERDLMIKGRGLPFAFERTYNSLAPENGPLGFGWTHSFNHRLAFADARADGANSTSNADGLTSSVTWFDGTGATRLVAVTGTAGGVAVGAAFTPPSGFYFQMARQVDGTYTVREKNGLTYTFESVAGTVDQRARLVRIADRNGNALRLAYTGPNLTTVTDDLGRALTFTYDASNRIVELRDFSGRRREYGYDANGDLVAYRNPLALAGTQDPVTYAYYGQAPLKHFMQRYTLPRGNGMTFEYYPNGRVFRHTNTLGESTSFSYNMVRREALSVNELGLSRQYFFDPNGSLVKAVEEGGGSQVHTYDPANPFTRLTSRDPMGRLTAYAYDANGNVTRITQPSGATREWSHFNAFGQPGKAKDARGNYTVNKYDARGNLLQVIRLKSGVGAAVDPATYVPAPADLVAWTIHGYDAFGNVTSTRRVRDAATQAGPTVEFDYNDTANGVVGLNNVGVTRRGDKNGDGTIDPTETDNATLAYDALGRTTAGLRPDWYATQAVYDAADRVTRGTDAVGQLRDFAYDPNGNLLRESLTVGTTLWDEQKHTYDLSDRRITSANAAGHLIRQQYDAAGNVVAATNPDGYTTRFEYDANGSVVLASDEEGNRVLRALDVGGQVRSVTDPNGNVQRYEYYDGTREGRLKTKRDALGRATTVDYDPCGNITVATDNLGRTTLTTYDEQDRAVRVAGPAYTDASLGLVRPVTRYTYNLLGNLTAVAAGRTDASGTNPANDVVATQVTYQWDDFGRKLSETDALGRTRRWTYDTQGNALTATDAKLQLTQYTWSYGGLIATRRDQLGALTTWTRNPLGLVTQAASAAVTYTTTYDAAHRVATVTDSRGPVTMTYRWSPAGRLTSYEDNQGNRTDYAYDQAGRLSGIWSPKGDLVTFVYDAGGRLTDKWFPNGVTTQYTWNADNTLARLVNRYRGAGIFSSHDYTYDEVGNRATHNEVLAPAITTPYRYAYDGLDRLSAVTNSTTSAPIESYTYDPLGNRLTKTTGAGAITAYVYDAAGQLTEWHDGTAAGPLLGGQVFDANGNVVKKCEGGAVTASPTDCAGTTITTLAYNPLNQLSSAARTGLAAQSYLYDSEGRRVRKTVGGLPTQYLYMGEDIVSQYGSSMTVPAALFTHGPGADNPLIRATAGVSQYYHQDGLGSVVEFSNPEGTIAGNAQHDAFGVRLAAVGTLPVYGYAGREPDETGLVFNRARYYDPALGRFTQRDPIGLAGGVNAYAYVRNNPANQTDSSGLSPQIQLPDPIGATPPASYYGNASIGDAASGLVLAASGVGALPGAGAGSGVTAGELLGGLRGGIWTLPLLLSGDTRQNRPDVFLTYTRIGPDGTVYSGRTSGYADEPLQTILNRRASAPDHRALTEAGFAPLVLDQISADPDPIRGREQQLIDFNGGSHTVGGTSANNYNGVADFNPNRPWYMYRANVEFGPLPDNSPARARWGPELLPYMMKLLGF